MFARLSAFVIWSFVAATAMFWIMRLVVHAPGAPAHAVTVDRSTPARGDLARLFGAPLVARAEDKAAAPSRYKLIGVMAPKSQLPEGSGAYGLALIAVDGKPARAYAVGARLDDDLVLQSVGLRTASLSSDKSARHMVLELPPPAAAATGSLPVPGTGMRPVPMASPAVPAAQPVPNVQPLLPGVQPAAPPNGLQPPVPDPRFQ